MQFRYEITQEGFEDSLFSNDYKGAVEAAENMFRSGEGKTVTIHDKRAHKGKPKSYKATVCTGEAHSNPFIDHCWVCMPNWGVVVTPLELKS
jgi:hypothetical protein